MSYHEPVMLDECLEGLDIKPKGKYVDVTFGGGGHSKAILERLTTGKLYAFDQDDDAIAQAPEDERLVMVNHNFRFMKNFLRYHNAIPVQGILADLGISSHQIDVAERGFSHRFDAELDMRMNRSSGLSARDVLNEYDEGALQRLFSQYGELRNARQVTAAIIAARARKPLVMISDLKQAVARCTPAREESKFLSQLFQALRIEVNGELEALKRFLHQSVDVLDQGGRLVIMSYHSLEDRLVKNFINSGNFEGELTKDLYGNSVTPLKAISKKVVVAGEDELNRNPRARSAKLRIAEKL